MEERLIYIVMKSTGQYEDRFERPYKAFTDKEKAERLVKEKNDYYSDLGSRYMKIDIDVQTKLEEMFARYLQDTDKEIYEAYQKAIKHEEWFEDVEDTFDWDGFYEKQNGFKEDKALVSKYIEICGLTDKERDAVLVYLEYEENSQYHDGLPYFYVSHHVLKLEE